MNLWKASTGLLALGLLASQGVPLVRSASAEESRSQQLESALEHLKAAKSALDDSERRHHHHRPAIVATEFAIRAVSAEIAWRDHRDRDHGGGKPTEPGGGGKPTEPGGGGKPTEPGGGGKPTQPGP